MKMFTCKLAQNKVTHQRLRVGSKKSVQQGHSHFYARSVHLVREHGKMARTPLAAFFNRPTLTPAAALGHAIYASLFGKVPQFKITCAKPGPF
jgi:short subunit dehydrogenase-like uncharacterized protein